MKAKRIYKGSDANMLTQLKTMVALFEEHLADFTAFDPHLDNAYLTDWQAAAEATRHLANLISDNLLVAQDQTLIKDAEKILANCHLKYRDVKYFATKAFPDNREVRQEFGEGSYRKVRNSRLRMVQFMKTLHGVATKYKTQLIAQNFLQPAIDEIATLADALNDSNQPQQLKKKARPTETRKRIQALNNFYRFGQRVADAAKEVYRNSATEANMFRITKRHTPKEPKIWFTIGASGIRKTTLKKLSAADRIALTNQGKEIISYWQADSITETPAQKLSLSAGKTGNMEKQTPLKKFLLVQNQGTKAVRVRIALQND